ncbi:MAG: hypothetical protein KDI13_04735 [Alphaproteobacteria bacterium]|nr:hypothetical protein [Alphaproteobacteria bacterium]
MGIIVETVLRSAFSGVVALFTPVVSELAGSIPKRGPFDPKHAYSFSALFQVLRSGPDLHPPSPPAPPQNSSGFAENIPFSYTYTGENRSSDLKLYRAEKPRGTIFYILGFKTEPWEKERAITTLQRNGYNALVFTLPDPKSGTGFMEESIARLQSSFCNPAFIDRHRKAGPLFVMAHSTGVNVFEHAALRTRLESTFFPDIDGAFFAAPYLHPGGASPVYNPVVRRIYERHSRQNQDLHTGIPKEDVFYFYAVGQIQRLLEEHPQFRPTYGQIDEITAYGDLLLDAESHTPPYPVFVYFGGRDPYISVEAAKDYFSAQGAAFYNYPDSDHGVFMHKGVALRVTQQADKIALTKSGMLVPNEHVPIEDYVWG